MTTPLDTRGFLVVILAILTSSCGVERSPSEGATPRPFEGRRLVLFVGSASQPPTEDAARAFEERTGAKLDVHFGGSGAMLSQLKLARRGDIYFPGSSDYLELAKRQGLVDPATETVVAYLIPAINVPAGNPLGILSLEDLAKPGVRVGIARPDTVCVGLYAVEVLEGAGISRRVRENIVTNAESCAKTAQIVALRQVDAVLGWDVFTHWDPERIETIPLDPAQVPRIGTLPAAIGVHAQDRVLAAAFLEFLTSSDGRAIFAKWGYLTVTEKARPFAREGAPIGGEWPLPDHW
jgi:molybdate transport system substrate-binding protein